MAAPRKTAEAPPVEEVTPVDPPVDVPPAPPVEASEPTETSTKKSSTYKVLGALVEAKVGERVLHFYKGDVLPEGVDRDVLEHLKSLGFVAKV